MAGGHGGRRGGAGRKPGGGISPVKTLRSEARALLADIIGTDRDPLMVAIDIAADTSKPDPLRLEAALGAARYLHPTLSAQAIATVQTAPDQNRLIAGLVERLDRIAAPSPAPTIEGVAERDVAEAEKPA